MKTLKEKYSDRRPSGVCADNAFGGLLVFEPLPEDKADCDYVTCFEYDGIRSSFRKSNVKYHSTGGGYDDYYCVIHRHGRSYPLSEILAVRPWAI